MNGILDLQKTAKSESKITTQKNRFYRFIAQMVLFAAEGIAPTRSQNLDPENLKKFLGEWLKVSPDANLDHVILISGPVVKAYNKAKTAFIEAQVDLKMKSFASVIPLITEKEVKQLEKAMTAYRKLLKQQITAMEQRVELAVPTKATEEATA